MHWQAEKLTASTYWGSQKKDMITHSWSANFIGLN